MSVNTKMKAIADEIRELSGTTGAMGLDAMASTLNAENTNFASNLTTQDNLISQIQTALQNKAAATGEDVTSETTAYTTKLATLETAITALETELQGKASGGSGGSVETCTGTIESIEVPYPNSVWFLNSDMQPTSLTPTFKKATTFTAIKGSFVFINGSTTINRTLEGVTLLYSNGYNIIVSIDSDGFTIIT